MWTSDSAGGSFISCLLVLGDSLGPDWLSGTDFSPGDVDDDDDNNPSARATF